MSFKIYFAILLNIPKLTTSPRDSSIETSKSNFFGPLKVINLKRIRSFISLLVRLISHQQYHFLSTTLCLKSSSRKAFSSSLEFPPLHSFLLPTHSLHSEKYGVFHDNHGYDVGFGCYGVSYACRSLALGRMDGEIFYWNWCRL